MSIDPRKLRKRAALVGGLALAAFVAMVFVPPIPQDPKYHDFADKRGCCGVPNFADVVSNVPFAVVGVIALAWLRRRDLVGPRAPFASRAERRAWAIVSFGCLLTGFGSAYYHWAPGNETLFWDRLPMTICFMSLFAIQIMERISLRAGSQLIVPLVVFGACSILMWRWTEFRGKGDLRLYALVQFYPMLAIPLMLAIFPPRYNRTFDLVIVLLWYIAAKAFENWDRPIFMLLGGAVSGHTLKHLAAGAGMAWLLRMVMKRRALPETPAGVTVREEGAPAGAENRAARP